VLKLQQYVLATSETAGSRDVNDMVHGIRRSNFARLQTERRRIRRRLGENAGGEKYSRGKYPRKKREEGVVTLRSSPALREIRSDLH
jgi:hypothetical protein